MFTSINRNTFHFHLYISPINVFTSRHYSPRDSMFFLPCSTAQFKLTTISKMKFAFGLAMLVCLGTSIEGTKEDYSAGDIAAFRNFVAQNVFNVVSNKLRNFHGPIEQNPSARATIVPPIDDPLTADPLNICGLDITIPVLNISVQGDINVMDPVVTGLSQFNNDLNVDLILLNGGLTIDLDIDLPEVNLVSPYMAEVVFSDNRPGSLDMTGNGVLPCGATDVFLKFHGKGVIPPLIPGGSLDELEVDLGFKNLMFDPSGLTSQGAPVNLNALAERVQTLFDTLWTEPTKIAVNEIIRCLIDDLVSECSLATIVIGGSINLDCLKDTIKLECLPSEESSLEKEYVFQTPVCEWLETTPTDDTEATSEGPTVTPSTGPTVTPPTGPTVTPPTGPTVTPDPNASSFFKLSPIIIAFATALSIGNILV